MPTLALGASAGEAGGAGERGYNFSMLLDLPYILETRRNHALEHATLHMLAREHQGPMAGHSNPTGFFIFATSLSFNFMGDGLRDALDPRMKV